MIENNRFPDELPEFQSSEKLDRFIANPDEVVPGNSMKPYGGLASSDERKKIIGFLAQSR
jgi:cytochrome c